MTMFVATQSELAEQVLDLVRAEVPGAEAEVAVERAESALTRFANSYIHQNVATAITHVVLRLHVDGRTATGTSTRTDRDGLKALVASTAAAARLLPADPMWAGVAPPTGITGSGIVDPATATATPADRAAKVKAFVDAAAGLDGAGYCRTSFVAAGFVNSAGHTAVGAYTEAAFDGVARAKHEGEAPADGVARRASTALEDLDGAVLGARAAAKARAAVTPSYLPPGRYEVVLEPDAVGDLLNNLSVYAFNGKAYAEHRTFVEPGGDQFDPALSIVDDAAGSALPYDSEGTPKRRHDLVASGRTASLTHDRRTAKEAGTESTGHAWRGSEVMGPLAANLQLTGGGTADGVPEEVPGPIADSEVAALVAGVRRGLLVTDFWYTRVLDPRPLMVTGLTRNGLWLIEDGEVQTPVRNLRFTQPYAEALAPGQILGAGSTLHTLVSGWEFAAHRAPALRLASWHFTGGAEG